MTGRTLDHDRRQQARLGVFADNRARPFHRWFPFVEGFSAALVERALSEWPSHGALLDPFGGSGTSGLTAAMLGHDSYFAESNPYMAWVADVKINQVRAAAGDTSSTKALRKFAATIENSYELPRSSNADHALLSVDSRRHFFPEGVAARVLGTVELISQTLEGSAAEIAKLTVAASAIPSSSMIRRTDLRRRTARDASPANLRTEILTRLQAFVSDIEIHGASITGRAHQIGTDARESWQTPEMIDLIVTSPPYLNGTNYCRNSKLELLALGFINSEAGLRHLRGTSVTAGINNVTSRELVRKSDPAVEIVAEQLDAIAYDRRIPALIRSYFIDMRQALTSIRVNSSANAHLYLDIGDSVYSGIRVPTGDLLVSVAAGVGWSLKERELIRARRSYDGTPLTQELLHFEAA